MSPATTTKLIYRDTHDIAHKLLFTKNFKLPRRAQKICKNFTRTSKNMMKSRRLTHVSPPRCEKKSHIGRKPHGKNGLIHFILQASFVSFLPTFFAVSAAPTVNFFLICERSNKLIQNLAVVFSDDDLN